MKPMYELFPSHTPLIVILSSGETRYALHNGLNWVMCDKHGSTHEKSDMSHLLNPVSWDYLP